MKQTEINSNGNVRPKVLVVIYGGGGHQGQMRRLVARLKRTDAGLKIVTLGAGALSPEPDSLEPDSPEPDSLEPDSPEPDSPEPDSPEPDSLEPDSLEPDSPEPDSLEPDKSSSSSPVLAHYSVRDVRNKHQRLVSLLLLLPVLIEALFKMIQISRRYQVAGVISTGPGLCIMPMLLWRLMGVKTVFIETFCRFETRSWTGRVMSRIAHRFLVQNKALQVLYPNAEYCGRL